MLTLGISAYYHDSAAALLRDGEIVGAAQEERFTRKKHDAGFPEQAIRYCLQEAGCSLEDVSRVVFYDKPLVKFERLLETYLTYAPRGFGSFVKAMPVWLKEKLYLKSTLRKELGSLSGLPAERLPRLLFAEHHQSHAASAFYPSPFERAAVLCLDGVGEWATSSAWHGSGRELKPLWEIDFPHSLGLLYSAFTYYAGFKVNSGEYKLMGLAPYGEPRYVDVIRDNLIDIKQDGTFRLNMAYFNFATGLTMTNAAFDQLFGAPPRRPESPLTQREMDIARSIQAVTEEVVLRLAATVQRDTGEDNLCLAGGVALNCVANGRLLREGPFKTLWIQPAAGDAGGALGAAYLGWHEYDGRARTPAKPDAMKGSYLGPRFGNDDVRARLESHGARMRIMPDEELLPWLARRMADGAVVGWFQGRMEFGPRALGGRSIIGDPRNAKMQSVMNLKIKYRESFRPFAPSVLRDRVNDYFELDADSPYMLLVAQIKQAHRLPLPPDYNQRFGLDKLHVPRSTLPAITHVDFSARVQTVTEETNPRYYRLIKAFDSETGCPVIVNTSFNVRGEPIVGTPEDAFRCFMRTEMDVLVIENYVLEKSEQTPVERDESWQQQFELD